jgi:hypothetical protein
MAMDNCLLALVILFQLLTILDEEIAMTLMATV